MSGMELNKLMAAILVAGIVASFAGFIAKEAIHPHKLHENAVKIDGVEEDAGGGVTKQTLPEPILAMIAGADVAQGEKISKACATCHSFDKGGPDGTGPNLWGVVNRAKAGKGGFEYSEAMKTAGGNWSYSDLNHFLWKPKAYVNGTKMNFIGLKKPEDRAAIIAWLRTKSDGQAALPSDAQIKAEEAELAPPAPPAEAAEGKPAEGEKPAEAAPAAGH